MSLELFSQLPELEIEKIYQALEHTTVNGRLLVQFIRIPQMVLDELVRYEVITQRERGYHKGSNFDALKEYITT